MKHKVARDMHDDMEAGCLQCLHSLLVSSLWLKVQGSGFGV